MTKRKMLTLITVTLFFLIAVIVFAAITNIGSLRVSAPAEPMDTQIYQTMNPPPVSPSDTETTPRMGGIEERNTPNAHDGGDNTEDDDDQNGTPASLIPQLPPFQPYAIEETEPDLMIASTGIMVDGEIVDNFTFPETMDFGFGNDYAALDGIFTFRGNNFRDTASFGFADIKDEKFGDTWFRPTGVYTASDGMPWSGHGWTGQPLIVRWPFETRQIMNMHDWAKEKDDLVEVIYPALDGYVYFAELETGEATRDNLYLGFTFKGSGALDPRGYPLLYVGAGVSSARGSPRILIVSLVDGSVLHTFGNADSFAPRGWNAADASALVDAATDNLIYPSENGVIYIIKLNSEFDPASGTMTIDPSAPVKWRFRGIRSDIAGKYWLGFEASPVIWRGHLIIADNGGHLICLDLNTLEIVWVQDVVDDTNCSPVLELEDGHPYIYISTSFHGGWRAPTSSTVDIPIWKIDAMTGEILWQTDYDCYTVADISGGVQGTIALGQHELRDLIFVPVARTPTRDAGILAALDKRTGEIVWELQTRLYSWSSPVCVYDKSGKGYVIHCDLDGHMYLLDGLSGEVLDTFSPGMFEASPAVFENTVVIGSRMMQIWGVTIT